MPTVNVNQNFVPAPTYECRFPAIEIISDLQEARDNARFDIVFQRNGYTSDDVVESRLYTYIGEFGENRNFVPDTMRYIEDIDATEKGFVTLSALMGASGYPYSTIGDYGVDVMHFGVNVSAVSGAWKYDVPEHNRKYNASMSSYNASNNNLCGWRHVVFAPTSDKNEYYADSNYTETVVTYGTHYERTRSPVFLNPTLRDSKYGNIYDSTSGVYATKYGISGPDVKNRVCLEVDFNDLFYTDSVSAENVPEYMKGPDSPDKYSNIDYDPIHGKMQISTKDRGKLLYDVLKGKTPMFFMIVEKLNKTYAGLSNLYVYNDGARLHGYSTKRQVIYDTYHVPGDILWSTDAVLGGGEQFVRVSVELANGDEHSEWNPGFDDSRRMVWATTNKGNIYAFDYFNGDRLIGPVRGSNNAIYAMASNPADRTLVFVDVVSNAKSGFANIKRIDSNGRISTVRTIDDLAKNSRFSMTGGNTVAQVAGKMLGGVISRGHIEQSGENYYESKDFWFTFIVNKEFTVSVQVIDGDGNPTTNGVVTFADRMHYGLFHGKNFAGNYSNSPQAAEYDRVKFSEYAAGVEYGVPANRNNVTGITNGINGNVYVNGHTYLHFDDRHYSLVTGHSPSFGVPTWTHDGKSGLKACGGALRETPGPYVFVKSYVLDFSTGKWKKNSAGKFVTEYRSPCYPGCWPIVSTEIHGHMNNGLPYFTSKMMQDSGEASESHARSWNDGEHRCAMSINGWKGQKRSEYDETVSMLGSFDNHSFDEIDTGDSKIVVYYDNMQSTPDGMVGTDSRGKVENAMCPAGNEATSDTGSFGQNCNWIPRNDENWGGSGWYAHMNSFSIQMGKSGGGHFFAMLKVGYIYNANSNYGTSYGGNSDVYAANKDMGALNSQTHRFWATNGLSEDSPQQIGGTNNGHVTVGSFGEYNFNYSQVDPGTLDDLTTPSYAYLFQRNNTTEDRFRQKFDQMYNSLVLYPDISVMGTDHRTGFTEDARFGNGRHARGGPGITGASLRAVVSYESRPVQILSENWQSSAFGMLEGLDNYGGLIDGDGRRIYEIVETGRSGNMPRREVRMAAYTNNDAVLTSVKTNSVMAAAISITGDAVSLTLDDTGGIWTSVSDNTVLGESPTGGNRVDYKPVYDLNWKSTQVTNFGHCRSSHPYLEHMAWVDGVVGRKIPYEKYKGAKDYVSAVKARMNPLERDIVQCGSVFPMGNAVEYNDDPIGMAGIKALGYCWTKSTKIHCMDVDPSGRMFVIDHYVMENTPCMEFDRDFMGGDLDEGVYVLAKASDAFPSAIGEGDEKVVISADRMHISAISANSWSSFTSSYLLDSMSAINSEFSDEPLFPNILALSGELKGVDYPVVADRWVSSGIPVSGIGVGRPKNGLPRIPKSFWDYSSDEPLTFPRESDERAAVAAYAKVGMIKTAPIYFSDYSTVVPNPVSFRCAGYDTFYTNHLVSIHDSGTYDIDYVEYTFSQNNDFSGESKAKSKTTTVSGTSLSSITVADSTIEITGSRSNNDIRHAKAQTAYNRFRDAFCCSADVISSFGDGWTSINAYGKPMWMDNISSYNGGETIKYMGNELSAVVGQTTPRQWYGTEVYRWMYEKDDRGNSTDNLISYLRPVPGEEDSGMSAYGFHPSVHVEVAGNASAVTSPDISAGAIVTNSIFGEYGRPHVVFGKAVTNAFCYADPYEQPQAKTVDLGRNYVYVFERWPSQAWSVHCENSRGGLTLFGDCPDFDEE